MNLTAKSALILQRIFVAVAIIFSLVSNGALADIPLTKNGKPVADIVIEEKAHPAVKFAAEELQHWVKEISGAELPILHAPGIEACHIILETGPEGFAEDLAKLKGKDGYAVRTKGFTVHLFGSKPKGVLNGIYKLLMYNTDIIWARPNTEFGTIFSNNLNLSLTSTNFIDVPVYKMRGWQMSGSTNQDSDMWQIRNCNNWSNILMVYKPEYEKYGMIFEYGWGHNLTGLYIPEAKYFEKHPEFFPFIEGKRVRPSAYRPLLTQLCFSNKELVEAFIREVDDKIDANPKYDTYRIMIEDNYRLCECPECMKPIVLTREEAADPKGKLCIQPDDNRFRSTQFFLFLNKIARHVKEKYPDKEIRTFAYFFTEPAPYCKVEDNILISFCTPSKSSKYPMDSPKNKVTASKFNDWRQIGAAKRITLREYYGLVAPFPRPIDAIAIKDWRYLNKYGVDHTYSEMYADNVSWRMDGVKTWDLNAPYFWVMTNGAWNPYKSIDTLRKEFFRRAYGPASADVEKFYSIIERSWHKAGGNSLWNDRAGKWWLHAIIEPGNTDKCRRLLDKAAKKVEHPNSVKMLAALRNTFEHQINRFSHQASIKAARAGNTPEFDPDFNTGDWQKAEPVNNFVLRNQQPAKEKTTVKILYDKDNLYIGAKCFDKETQEIFAKPAGQPRDVFPKGDKFELFLTGKTDKGKECFYQIAFDTNGNLYDSLNSNKDWNGEFKVLRKITEDGWSTLVIVPFKTLNLKLSKKTQIKTTFLRYRDHKGKRREVSYWEYGIPHDPSSFGSIVFN